MSSQDDRDSMPLYEPRRKTSPGWCGLGAFVLGVLVCFWLIIGSPSPLRTRLCTKPLVTTKLLNVNDLVHDRPLAHHLPDVDAVTGKTSLSATLVNRMLARFHSPAAGIGQLLYDLAVQSHLDDGDVQGHVTILLVGYACTPVGQVVAVCTPASDGNDVVSSIAVVEQAVDVWQQEEGEAVRRADGRSHHPHG